MLELAKTAVEGEYLPPSSGEGGACGPPPPPTTMSAGFPDDYQPAINFSFPMGTVAVTAGNSTTIIVPPLTIVCPPL
jgi:hypothetical protein